MLTRTATEMAAYFESAVTINGQVKLVKANLRRPTVSEAS